MDGDYIKRMTESEFNARMNERLPHVEKIDAYINAYHKIHFGCKNCGETWLATPHSLLYSSKGCPKCFPKYLKPGENDFASKAPHLICFFKNKDEAYKVPCGSRKQLTLRCPICGYERKMTASDFFKSGFHCHMCDDGVSYPNKLIHNVMKQLHADRLEFEWAPDWANGRRFDVYFELDGKKYVIEMDGAFHSVEFPSSNRRPLGEVVRVDLEKNSMAKQNGITMIRIDCKQSRLGYIRPNIEGSLLNELFDLSSVDWQKCHAKSQSSLVLGVCDYYNSHPGILLGCVADEFGLTKSTISLYLRAGSEAGICSFAVHDTARRAVIVSDKDDVDIADFNSIGDCAEFMNRKYDHKFHREVIGLVCSGKQESYHGFKFRYKYPRS